MTAPLDVKAPWEWDGECSDCGSLMEWDGDDPETEDESVCDSCIRRCRTDLRSQLRAALARAESAEADARRLRDVLRIAASRFDSLARWEAIGYAPSEYSEAAKAAAVELRAALTAGAGPGKAGGG